MKVIFLGTGTSTGVPTIGCDCNVCKSKSEKNKRLRSSILIKHNSKNILIDTSTDLRQQALNNNIKNVDAVLFTHHHADHVHGIDDLRTFNVIQKDAIPCYGNKNTIDSIHAKFSYIFNKTQKGGGKPKLNTHVLNDEFNLFGINIVSLNIMHGELIIAGYKFNNSAYLTDCSFIPEESKMFLYGLDLLILDALRFKPHPTHFSLSEALDTVSELKPKRALFTHINHNMDHDMVSRALPDFIELAYDGMVVENVL